MHIILTPAQAQAQGSRERGELPAFALIVCVREQETTSRSVREGDRRGHPWIAVAAM